MSWLNVDIVFFRDPIVHRWSESVTVFDRLRQFESVDDYVDSPFVRGLVNLRRDIEGFGILEAVLGSVVHHYIECHLVALR